MGYQENNGYIEILSNYFSVDFSISKEFTDSFEKENLELFMVASEREKIIQQRLENLQNNAPSTGGGGPDLLELFAPIVMTVCSPANIQYILNSCLSGVLWDLIKYISMKIKLIKKDEKKVAIRINIHKENEDNITDMTIETCMSQDKIANCIREAIMQGLSMKSDIHQ